jgi:hypothetical protein
MRLLSFIISSTGFVEFVTSSTLDTDARSLESLSYTSARDQDKLWIQENEEKLKELETYFNTEEKKQELAAVCLSGSVGMVSVSKAGTIGHARLDSIDVHCFPEQREDGMFSSIGIPITSDGKYIVALDSFKRAWLSEAFCKGAEQASYIELKTDGSGFEVGCGWVQQKWDMDRFPRGEGYESYRIGRLIELGNRGYAKTSICPEGAKELNFRYYDYRQALCVRCGYSRPVPIFDPVNDNMYFIHIVARVDPATRLAAPTTAFQVDVCLRSLVHDPYEEIIISSRMPSFIIDKYSSTSSD